MTTKLPAKMIDDLDERFVSRAMGVASYAATARLRNEPGWMEGLARRINRLLEVAGDDSRVHFDGDTLRIRPALEIAEGVKL